MIERFTVSVSASKDWDLHRKAQIDFKRHEEKLYEAIKDGIFDLIQDSDLILSSPKQILRVPLRYLDLPRFKFKREQQSFIGQGSGNSKVGEKIGSAKEGGQEGGQGGTEPGVDSYDLEIETEKLMEMIFPEFKLPNLKPKGRQTQTQDVAFETIAKVARLSNLDKKRTVLEAIKRAKIEGREVPPVLFKNEDLRVRTFIEKKKDQAAVVFLLADRSASIGKHQLKIQKLTFWWIVNALKFHYPQSEVKFITFHTQAQERKEDEFWKLIPSGGTRIASSFELVKKMVEEKFDPNDWNIYLYLVSDGDGQGHQDNVDSANLMKELLERGVNQIGYFEQKNIYPPPLFASTSNFYDHINKALAEKVGKNLILSRLNSVEDVKKTIREVFKE